MMMMMMMMMMMKYIGLISKWQNAVSEIPKTNKTTQNVINIAVSYIINIYMIKLLSMMMMMMTMMMTTTAVMMLLTMNVMQKIEPGSGDTWAPWIHLYYMSRSLSQTVTATVSDQ